VVTLSALHGLNPGPKIVLGVVFVLGVEVCFGVGGVNVVGFGLGETAGPVNLGYGVGFAVTIGVLIGTVAVAVSV
jgi:hypothetical protein